ncbi:MAG: serine kinase [Chloroflexi bacterium]|nr:serine kinase [Chloroflexota bacterium]OQB02272.1 MAG: DRTGG domain protein [Chloroflexi bacterium ADurb.Bin222]HOC21781.1 DRTGG domain-containing protein [Anaerolineae bacterium]HOS79435.1 DRTGG domain-containing protein [Anaerolineae bacterium]HQE98536.1 DRTGG domain-containing protein [Anaerolineae bacterium]
MILRDIVTQLDLQVLAGEGALDQEVTGGYIADLLSCVMAGAQPGQLWFTLQTHLNIVAVASLVGVAAIVITEAAAVGPETINRAAGEGVVLLRSAEPTFETVMKLARLL